MQQKRLRMEHEILQLETGNHVITGISPDSRKEIRKLVAAYNRAYLRQYPNEAAPILISFRGEVADVAIRERMPFEFTPPVKFAVSDFEGIEADKFIPTDKAGINRIRQIAHKLGGLSVREVDGGCVVGPKAVNNTVNAWVARVLGEFVEPIEVPFTEISTMRTVRPAVSRWNKRNGGGFCVRKIQGRYFVVKR